MIPKVYILLPVHNRRDITRKFIDSLLSQTFGNYHLLLIDDGSIDDTDKMVRALVSTEKLTVIKGKGNWWWAGSLQQGITWLEGHAVKQSDVVLMINDDVIFGKDFLENGLSFLNAEPDALLLAQYFDEEKKKIIESGIIADFEHLSFQETENPGEINCLSTRGLFMRWNVCRSVGGFYPRILPHYGSDYEFTMRAARKGFALRTTSAVYLVPNHGTTGIRSAEQVPDIRTLFSKRYVMNPVYWTVFILLASPLRWVPVNLVKIWFGALRTIRKGDID